MLDDGFPGCPGSAGNIRRCGKIHGIDLIILRGGDHFNVLFLLRALGFFQWHEQFLGAAGIGFQLERAIGPVLQCRA
jgi:hypothetical protein